MNFMIIKDFFISCTDIFPHLRTRVKARVLHKIQIVSGAWSEDD